MIDSPPPPVAPRRVPAGFRRRFLADKIEPRGAAGAAAADAGESHPAAGPEAVAGDRLVGIVGARRQVPAVAADQARKRELLGADQPMGGLPRQALREVGAHHSAAAGCTRLAAISSSALTTASKVSIV